MTENHTESRIYNASTRAADRVLRASSVRGQRQQRNCRNISCTARRSGLLGVSPSRAHLNDLHKALRHVLAFTSQPIFRVIDGSNVLYKQEGSINKRVAVSHCSMCSSLPVHATEKFQVP